MDKPTTIQGYNDAQDDETRAICNALHEVIDSHLDDAESKIWHAHPVWFLAGNPIVGYGKQKDGVRLLFWSGQSFETPGLDPSGTFKAAEARFRTLPNINAALIGRWLAEARSVQWDYKNIVKRRGVLERLS
jgi:hypothetical protein